MLGCNSFKESQQKACDCGEIDYEPNKDKVHVNTGKSSLTHERKVINAKPIPGTENASAKKSSEAKTDMDSDTTLKATNLKVEKSHQHDDL
jgi:hypothetical protein